MADNEQLKKLKIALQLKDDDQDDLLELYLADATDFLKLRLSLADGDELPAQMQAIVRAVAVKKFICNKKTVSMILTAFFYLVG